MTTERDIRNQIAYARKEGFNEGLAELEALCESKKAEGIAEGKAEGITKGKQEAMVEVAKAMKENGSPVEYIAKCTGLSLETISKLQLFEVAEFVAMPREQRNTYIAKMTTERDIRNQIAYARKEGLLEGIAEGKAEGIAEGITKGKQEAMVEVAKAMKENGSPVEYIAKCTGLSLETISKLQFFEVAEFVAMPREQRNTYIAKMTTERDIRNQIAYARKEGFNEGLAELEALCESKKAEGKAEGKTEGIAEGTAKGKAEGKVEGIAEGIAKGQFEACFGR